MFNLEIISGYSRKPALEIVWRNPHPVPTRRRRQDIKYTPECTQWTLQEFVDDGDLGYWRNVTDLEVVAGGRAA